MSEPWRSFHLACSLTADENKGCFCWKFRTRLEEDDKGKEAYHYTGHASCHAVNFSVKEHD
ncbi:hypothetical protein KY289_013498 [Solanum tuberosum]|nr:hypothetical protein KY289_013498 [Solanum tuberosum]